MDIRRDSVERRVSPSEAGLYAVPADHRLGVPRATSSDSTPHAPAAFSGPPLPDMGLDPTESDVVLSSGWVAHLQFITRGEVVVTPHPGIRRSIDAKLRGRSCGTIFDTDRIDIVFGVADRSPETNRQIGAFALALGPVLGVRPANIRHHIFYEPLVSGIDQSH